MVWGASRRMHGSAGPSSLVAMVLPRCTHTEGERLIVTHACRQSERSASTLSTLRGRTKSELHVLRRSASSFTLTVPKREKQTTWAFTVQTPSRLVVADQALVRCRSEATMQQPSRPHCLHGRFAFTALSPNCSLQSTERFQSPIRLRALTADGGSCLGPRSPCAG
jgi:hypothetical protein